MADDQFKDHILVEMHKDMGVLKSDVAAIKVDVKEHVRRTNILETRTEFALKHIYYVYGGWSVITLLAGILKFLKVF